MHLIEHFFTCGMIWTHLDAQRREQQQQHSDELH